MSNAAQKAILTAKIGGVLKDLMVQTNAAQVIVGDTNLEAKLAELVAALDGKAASEHKHLGTDISVNAITGGGKMNLDERLARTPTTEAMNTAISTAISKLIDGAPETYDTLKEIADYIEAHQDVVDALNAAIGNKADASTVTTLQTLVDSIKSTVDGLGALATKDAVAESDLDAELAAKINASTAAKHTHDNKSVLDGISAEMVTAWNGKGTVYASAEQPQNLAEGDMWVQLVD